MLNWLYNIFEQVSGNWIFPILIACLLVGVIVLIKSADVFVEGAADLARKLRVPTFIIGLTIVSFGTSAPEASVSIFAAINNNGDISLGNVVGSNICNILLVLGLPAIFSPIIINYKEVRNDILIMIGSTILLILCVFFIDVKGAKAISLFEGIILLSGIVSYVVYNVINAKRLSDNEKLLLSNAELENPDNQVKEASEQPSTDAKPRHIGLIILAIVVGLVGVLVGGDLVTYSAKNLAIEIGISEVLVGLTVVALCTSLPELVTTLVASRKNENDIAIGNVVGSNIFNLLFILGVTSVIRPLGLNSVVIVDIVIVLVLSIVVFLIAKFKGQISRKLGAILFTGYVLYIVFLIIREFYL